jgi:hypothetical protein
MENLRKRPTYNELINYLEFEQPKIKYPDRRATFLRNSPYLTQFDGQSWIDLEKQENEINKEKMKEMEVRRTAGEEQSTAQAVRASLTQRQAPKLNVSMLFDTGYDSGVDSYMDDMEEEEQRSLDENVRRLNAMKSLGSRAVGEASAQEERDYGFLGSPYRPSAPPESIYGTPVAPRNLAEEFKTPPSKSKMSDSAPKLIEETKMKLRKEKAEEARAKAIGKKEEEHKKTIETLMQPYQATSSSSASPHGLNPVPLPKDDEDKKEENITYFKKITELKNLNLQKKAEQIRLRGIKVPHNAKHADLNKIIDQNSKDFLVEGAKQREQKMTAWTQSSSSKKK